MFCFLLSRIPFYWPPWAEVIDHPTGLELIRLKTISSPLPMRTIQPSPSSSRLLLFSPLQIILYWMFFGSYHLDAKSNGFHVFNLGHLILLTHCFFTDSPEIIFPCFSSYASGHSSQSLCKFFLSPLLKRKYALGFFLRHLPFSPAMLLQCFESSPTCWWADSSQIHTTHPRCSP